MEKTVRLVSIILAITVPSISLIGALAVLFYRVGTLEKQDTTKLENRITAQWKVVSEIQRNQNRFLGEWEFIKDTVRDNEQQIDALRSFR